MKTLSVRQPWATLIAEGGKTVEVRSWKTNHRGELLISASGKPFPLEDDCGQVVLLPTQVLVCVVDLIDCRPFLRTDLAAACMTAYDTGFFSWVLANPRMVRPVTHKGKLMLYETPSSFIEPLPPDLHFLDAA